MKIALITKSATTSSGARAPIELGLNLAKICDLTIFAQTQNYPKELNYKLKNLKLYNNPWQLYRLLKSGNFDFISFHATLTEIIAAKLSGHPIIRTYYGTQFNAYLEKFLPDQKPDSPAKIINFFANLAIWTNQLLMLLLSNQIIAISSATQKELKKLYWRNSQVIYLGSSLKPTHQSSVISHQSSVTILSVSRITPYKGFHHLISIVESLRAESAKLKLIITGLPTKKKYLKYLQKIKNAQDQIIIKPNDNTLKMLYQQCDIVTSCDRYPFFGLSLLEAAQFAKPAIALNYLAAPELITHGKTGFVANSLAEFKQYLNVLLKNKALRIKMGKRAKNLATVTFDYSKIAASYYQIFQKVESGNQSKRGNFKSKIVLAIVGILLSIMLLEIYTRAFVQNSYSQTTPSFFKESQNSIIELEPSVTRILKSKKAGEFTTTVTINSQGLRNDYDYQIPKPPDTYRILMLGDSFTFGLGVESAESFSKILEAALNEKYPDKHFEVLNAGLASGFTWDEAYLYTKAKGLLFAPDLIIENVFLGNDIIDFEGHNWLQTDTLGLPKKIKSENTYVSQEGFRSKFTFRAKNPKLYFAGIFNNLICDPLAFCKILRPFIERNISTFLAMIDPARNLPYFQFLAQNPKPEIESWWQMGQKILIGLNKLATENNTQFLVVNIPIKEQVWDPDNILAAKRLNDQRLPTFLQQSQIPYCDTKAKLKNHPDQNYFKFDSHLTEIGHQRVAQALVDCSTL